MRRSPFLSSINDPPEITFDCRRNEANNDAGFKIIYKSPTGVKTAGHLFTIPDNKDWHTARFRLEDPQFVNYWGYHFALVSDGNVFNRYDLKSVEVRKVKGGGKPGWSPFVLLACLSGLGDAKAANCRGRVLN